MNFKYCKIDPTTASISEINNEIQRLKSIRDDYENLQMALKIFINSAYGAIGNQYFQCYNSDVAEAITTQGRDILQYSIKYINLYFKEKWHKDKKLHSILNIKVIRPVINDVVIYGDTDSTYVTFSEVYDSVEFIGDKLDHIEFIKQIYNNRLNEYFNIILEKYSKQWNTNNIQEFELETIAYSGIWLAKKKYVLNIAWKDSGEKGIYYDKETKISPKGIEIAQSTYPEFARSCIKDLIKYIFNNGKKMDITSLMKKIKKMKDDFKLQNIENISLLKGISDYSKYVLNDRTGLTLALKCPIHIKAAATHNYSVNSSKYKNKYELIKSGDKIKFYYVKNSAKDFEVFGFLPNTYPAELAPDFDYDTMFTKCILDPINRFLVALSIPEIPTNLVFVKSLW